MGDVDLLEGCTTRIDSSRAMTQVQAGAGADHHRRRTELDRDLGGIMAVIPGVDVARTIDFINQAEGTAEAVTTTKVLSRRSQPLPAAPLQRAIRHLIAAAAAAAAAEAAVVAAAAAILCIFLFSCSLSIS